MKKPPLPFWIVCSMVGVTRNRIDNTLVLPDGFGAFGMNIGRDSAIAIFSTADLARQCCKTVGMNDRNAGIQQISTAVELRDLAVRFAADNTIFVLDYNSTQSTVFQIADCLE